MKTANLTIKWLLWCHMSFYWKTALTIWPNIWKCNLSFSKIPISHLLWIENNLEKYTAPDQHFKIQMLNLWMSWENLCPNLTFTVENKMGNSHKRGWSHFKLNINDWDIPFPKILRIYQWIGKNIFHWGKWNEPIKLIR